MVWDNKFTLRNLQTEVKIWTEKNFDTSVIYHPLLGMQEEFGELAHAILKKEQGIRGTDEEHDDAARDAIGDIMIYVADYANRSGLYLHDAYNNPYPQWDFQDTFFRASYFLGLISEEHVLGASSTVFLDKFIQYLSDLCTHREWDLMDIVEETWTEVKKRDWVENPETGV